MEARFRIRTREGEEFRPRTTEIFAEFIRSGVVRPEDMVYDALTGEWVPAALHPMVRLMRDPLAGGRRPGEDGSGAADSGAADSGTADSSTADSSTLEPATDGSDGDGSDLTAALELVEPPSVSPEEETRAFIARMEDERRSNPDEPALSREVPLTPVLPRPPIVLPASAVAGAEGTRGGPDHGSPRTGLRRPTRVRAASPEPGQVRRSWGRAGLLGLAVAGSSVLLTLFTNVGRPPREPGGHMPELAGAEMPPVRAPREIANTEEAVRGVAYESFVSAVDRMRGDLDIGAVPAAWLTGRYLADPTAYPQVRAYWKRYLGYVEQARADETSLYRTAYLQALDEAEVSGPVRSLRLATALEDFGADRDARDTSYAHARELAERALALDDTLLALRGRVSYEPVVGPQVSAAPVIEAAGMDAGAQASLDRALDRVLKALRVDGRAVDMRAVPTWLATSLRDAGEGASARP